MAMKPLTRRSPDWTQTAPVKASATREIAATADEVFTALADHETWPEWFTSISRVERFGELDAGVGSNRSVFVGKVRIDEEFIVWDEGKEWGFTVIAASIGFLRSLNELVTIQDIGPDRVRVTYLMAIDPKPWAKPLALVARRQLKKNLGEALDNLGPHIAKNRTD
mgnify:CR=1 FL=1